MSRGYENGGNAGGAASAGNNGVLSGSAGSGASGELFTAAHMHDDGHPGGGGQNGAGGPPACRPAEVPARLTVNTQFSCGLLLGRECGLL